MRTSKVLQGAIIAKELDTHMYNQGYMLSKFANKVQKSKLIPQVVSSGLFGSLNEAKYFDLSDHDSLRILAHILIIVATLDRLSGSSKRDGALGSHRTVQENIIAAYISYLRLANLEEMVPLYSSKLAGPRLHETLSRNMIHILGDEARRHQISIIGKLGLNVDAFLKAQPLIYLMDVDDKSTRCEAKGRFRILENGPATLKYGRIVKPDFFGEDAEHVDDEDELIIRSMEWLLLANDSFVETCIYAIRVYKYFLSTPPFPRHQGDRT